MTRSNNIMTGLAHPFVTQLTKIHDLGATTVAEFGSLGGVV
jgi:hypothetical protein